MQKLITSGVFLLWILLVWPTSVSGQDVKRPVLDSETRLSWHQQHLEMQRNSQFKSSKWKHIGPILMSGRITDIAKPLDQPFTFYVSTASGGVWKTENEGTTWQPIFDDAPSASVGTISVDPSNSDNLWVGFGEANIFRSSMSGTGVYRSTDAGKKWKHVGLADTQHIARIIVHPENSDVVYVAASGKEYNPNPERGVYKTTDGGKNWEKVLFESDMAGAIDLAIDPKNPDILYASMWHRIRRAWSDPLPGDGGGIYKSTDAGKSWNRLSNGLPKRELCGRIGISVSANQPGTLYALIDSHEIARKAKQGERDSYGRQRKDVKRGAVVYRSDDHGENWTKVSQDSRLLSRLFSTYGWVFGQIRVDPSNVDTIYVMGVPLLKSTDGGKTFKSLNSRGLHGDHHAMWIDPSNPNYIINGNDGGVNISYDGGQRWKDLDNLPVVQFYNVSYDWAEPFNVYGSIQDNNSWYGPHTHNPARNPKTDWKPIRGGEASYFAIDPNNADIVYSESFYGSIMRTDRSTGKTKQIKPTPKPGDPPLRGQWLAPFQLSPHNSQVVYHGMNCLFRSMNRGDDWEQISGDLTYNDPEKQGNISYATISTLSESPKKFGVIYVGTDDGRLHVTRDSGKTWNEILDGLPKNKWISRVTASRFDEGTVYMTQNGKREDDFQVYVYRSNDYGKTWEDISGNIPGGPVNVITEDPKHPNILYVGTDMGVYVTTDNAKSWHVLGSDLPITFVHDLVVHPRDNVAVIATHGRGMFTLDVKPIQKAGKKLAAEIRAEKSFSQIKKKYDDGFQAFIKLYQKAKEEDRQAIVESKLPKPKDFTGPMFEVAKKYPDTPAAFQSLMWIATQASNDPLAESAYEVLFSKHIENEELGGICTSLQYSTPSPVVESRLQALIEKSPHDKVKAMATMSLANYLSSVSSVSEFYLSDEESMKSLDDASKTYMQEFVADESRIEKLFLTVSEKYGDVAFRNKTMKVAAEAALFELKYLSVGKVAPDIEGNDLDGVEFKLSDYRGKVVMIDFWGDW